MSTSWGEGQNPLPDNWLQVVKYLLSFCPSVHHQQLLNTFYKTNKKACSYIRMDHHFCRSKGKFFVVGIHASIQISCFPSRTKNLEGNMEFIPNIARENELPLQLFRARSLQAMGLPYSKINHAQILHNLWKEYIHFRKWLMHCIYIYVGLPQRRGTGVPAIGSCAT